MPIVYNIPPEGIDLYIRRRVGDLEKLKMAYELREPLEFFRIGHGLKGNAVCFGFPELETLGEKFEEVSKRNDWDLAQKLITELESWCHQKSKNL